MLAYVKQNRVDLCIVHKLDRLARNRADDVAIHLALRQAGVTLVSVSPSSGSATANSTPTSAWTETKKPCPPDHGGRVGSSTEWWS